MRGSRYVIGHNLTALLMSCALGLAPLGGCGTESPRSSGADDSGTYLGFSPQDDAATGGVTFPNGDTGENASTTDAGGNWGVESLPDGDAGVGGVDSGTSQNDSTPRPTKPKKSTAQCTISAGTSAGMYPTIVAGESKQISWAATPASSFSSCSVEHVLPDGTSHPDGLSWGSGLTGSRKATPTEANVGLHTFVLRCKGSGSTDDCERTAKLQVLKGKSESEHVERTVGFTGSGGTLWVHVVIREAGATTVSVRTMKVSRDQDPEAQYIMTTGIQPGQSKTASVSGKLPGGQSFTTRVLYEFANDQVTISHTATIEGSAPSAAQTHGVVSLAPDASAPYKRSLHYVGTGGAEWLHIATRKAGQDLVDVRTIRYNPAVAPAVYDNKIFGISAGGCKTSTTTGTFVSNGLGFTTQLQHCLSASTLTTKHRANGDGGSFGDWQSHGSMPIE